MVLTLFVLGGFYHREDSFQVEGLATSAHPNILTSVHRRIRWPLRCKNAVRRMQGKCSNAPRGGRNPIMPRASKSRILRSQDVTETDGDVEGRTGAERMKRSTHVCARTTGHCRKRRSDSGCSRNTQH
ncbi:hypothetical protein BV22DRAFT_677911 [Leucogyrophana mollusca]|uniref:Uncharacterized protein n=1 Tax=Leucogyrophana mollusca TaxID=85980 RepID=A0ACB8BAC6_9AGAM|nr:hypothetical protein BV22DRAFT_677911 [Leucogyrophana mollusca]